MRHARRIASCSAVRLASKVSYGALRRGRSVPHPASRRRYADAPSAALLTGLRATNLLQHRTDLFPLTDISVLPPCTPFFTLVGRAGALPTESQRRGGFSRRVESGRRGLRRPWRRTAMSVRTNRTHAVADRPNLYDEITGKIIAELEAGRFPWVQPWGTSAIKASLSLPRNASTHRTYSGINVLILWGTVVEHGFPTQNWITYRQAFALRTTIRDCGRNRTKPALSKTTSTIRSALVRMQSAVVRNKVRFCNVNISGGSYARNCGRSFGCQE